MRRPLAILMCLFSISRGAFGQVLVSARQDADAVKVSTDILGHDIVHPRGLGSHYHRASNYEVAIAVHVCAMQLAGAISNFNRTFAGHGWEEDRIEVQGRLLNMRKDMPILKRLARSRRKELDALGLKHFGQTLKCLDKEIGAIAQ